MNYNRGETIATGFVRPKVTSLFFDKIWIPESLLNSSFEFFAVPGEVQIKEKNETKIRTSSNKYVPLGIKYKYARMSNSGTDNSSILEEYLLASNQNQKIFRGLTSEEYISKAHTNFDANFFKSKSHDLFIKESSQEFKYSKNRNSVILLSSESFNRKYNLHISPVFHDLTEFEKQASIFNPQKLYGNNNLRFRVRKPNTFLNKDVLAICILDFPLVKEDELSWEQVLDFRRDKKRIEQLRQFINWSKQISKEKTPEQIKEMIESEMYEYKMALKEHGVKTATTSFSTIVSSASAVASLIEDNSSCLYPILSIISASIGFAANTYFSSCKNRNYPMAYLYNLRNDI